MIGLTDYDVAELISLVTVGLSSLNVYNECPPKRVLNTMLLGTKFFPRSASNRVYQFR